MTDNKLIICNTAFPLRQWLQERKLILGYKYFACFLVVHFVAMFSIIRPQKYQELMAEYE